MKIGIGLPNQVRHVRPTVIPEWARQAEQAGFSSLGTVGRIAYPGVMDTVALAAAAGATSTIGLLSTVLIAPPWPATLLAKEAAGIDGVSGGRLTLGIGLGGRHDDFVVDGLGPRGLGKRLDSDVQVYRDVWRGEPIGGGTNPGVPAGTREIPLLFGGMVPASFERVARSGEGYIGASMPAGMNKPAFDAVRAAWSDAGREGSPRLVAIAYYAFGDIDQGRANIHDYYMGMGKELADMVAAGVSGGPDAIKETVESFAAIGADELILNPSLDDLSQVAQLAATVL
ncbi:LLM class flavin-dependent oxidoreductase [Actinacidiphila oryziradicis]|jgi:alkanesulfonate monooxygenase SsuD/methylene tetrahydromethanopterin reductase-like flavin-dependent oxidoreductase (luciferase family)|uniref:LLM class flavin-dependent oxidoreductase n=1 Tax=Actinacidiphila oryziradicis TaxID=2571141 RepID=UPI0023F10C6E|nr:LLM class flavin-dependent oxidoreductase [Actinacidiphila oryziradicis]MCW2871583.1 Luciferase-like monooxygenase [Actinacidiphila oryziradicis]